MGDGSTHDGMGEIFTAGTKITGLYWSPDSAYLAISQSVQGGSAALTARSGISIKVRMTVGTDR